MHLSSLFRRVSLAAVIALSVGTAVSGKRIPLHLLIKQSAALSLQATSPAFDDVSSSPSLPLADDHQVRNLPGAPEEFKSRNWAGLLPVDDRRKGGKLFYWLFESQENAEEKPLTIWLNGGPGCSSFDGLLLELGPFRPQKDGSLAYNPYSWHHATNIMFIDQPVGTGLSTVGSTGYARNQSAVNKHMYNFLLNFFKVHPQFLLKSGTSHTSVPRTREIYFFGESYAGHYIPHIVEHILSMNQQQQVPLSIDVKGVGIGNGWSHPLVQYNYAPFSKGAGLINNYQTVVLSEKYELCKMTLDTGVTWSHHCGNILDEIVESSTIPGQPGVNYYDIRMYLKDSGKDWPMDAPYMESYLNREDVRRAIHASENKSPFTECSGPVGANLWQEDGISSIPQVVKLLESNVRVLFYNGQWDLICNHLGTQTFLNEMEWSQAKNFRQAARFVWSHDGQPAGYGRSTDDQALTFLVVLGGSHMVPMDVPSPALNMLQRFLANQTYDDRLQEIEGDEEGAEMDLQTMASAADSETSRTFFLISGSISAMVVILWMLVTRRGRRLLQPAGYQPIG